MTDVLWNYHFHPPRLSGTSLYGVILELKEREGETTRGVEPLSSEVLRTCFRCDQYAASPSHSFSRLPSVLPYEVQVVNFRVNPRFDPRSSACPA